MILFQNDNYVFVNKPSGMLTIPDRFNADLPSVVGFLKNNFEEIFVVHRLDRETSGCICFAKNAEAHRHASVLFETREVEKNYTALVHGIPVHESQTIENKLMEHPTIKGKMVVNAKQGKNAITTYTVLETFGNYSLVQCKIATGRMHQIRVHMQYIGNPVVCDSIYGTTNPVFVSQLKKKYKLSRNEENEKPILNRLALHSSFLSFKNLNGEILNIEAPLFKDMEATLKQMRKNL